MVWLLILEGFLTIIVCYVLVQLFTSMAESKGSIHNSIEEDESWIYLAPKRTMKFRFKFLFPIVAMMYSHRVNPENCVDYKGWDKDRISIHTFWFGISLYVLYLAITTLVIVFMSVRGVSFIRNIDLDNDAVFAVVFPVMVISLLYACVAMIISMHGNKVRKGMYFPNERKIIEAVVADFVEVVNADNLTRETAKLATEKVILDLNAINEKYACIKTNEAEELFAFLSNALKSVECETVMDEVVHLKKW